MIAYGELGLHPWEFYKYTMEEFQIKREGLRKAKEEEWDVHTRWLAFQVLSPHLKKGSKIDDVFPKHGSKKFVGLSASEMRQRTLEAARLSKQDGMSRRQTRLNGKK